MIISLTTYNRYDYLSRSLNSLLRSQFKSGDELFIWDDASDDPRVVDLLSSLTLHDNLTIHVSRRLTNVGVKKNATDGIRECFKETGSQYIVLTNSDAIYNPQWLTKIEETRSTLERQGILIGAITAFNMEYSDKEQYGHRVIGYVNRTIRVKESVGGLGVMINRDVFENMEQTPHGWDCWYVDACIRMCYGMFATDKSYVQHIGAEGLHSRKGSIIDTAEDFVGE